MPPLPNPPTSFVRLCVALAALTACHCGPDRDDDTQTPPPSGDVTVRVIHPGTGAGIEGITVVDGYNLEVVELTDADGQVTFEDHDPSDPITVVQRYTYDGGDFFDTVVFANTWIDVPVGQEIVQHYANPEQRLEERGSAEVAATGFADSSQGDTVTILTKSPWGGWFTNRAITGSTVEAEVSISQSGNPYIVAMQVDYSTFLDHSNIAIPSYLGVEMSPAATGNVLTMDVPFDDTINITMANVGSQAVVAYHDYWIQPPGREQLFFTAEPATLGSAAAGQLTVPPSVAAFGNGTKISIRALADGGDSFQAAVETFTTPGDLDVTLPTLHGISADEAALGSAYPGGSEVTASGIDGAAAWVARYVTRSYNSYDVHSLYWNVHVPSDSATATFPELPASFIDEPIPDGGYVRLDSDVYYSGNDIYDWMYSGDVKLPDSYRNTTRNDDYDWSIPSGRVVGASPPEPPEAPMTKALFSHMKRKPRRR